MVDLSGFSARCRAASRREKIDGGRYAPAIYAVFSWAESRVGFALGGLKSQLILFLLSRPTCANTRSFTLTDSGLIRLHLRYLRCWIPQPRRPAPPFPLARKKTSILRLPRPKRLLNRLVRRRQRSAPRCWIVWRLYSSAVSVRSPRPFASRWARPSA